MTTTHDAASSEDIQRRIDRTRAEMDRTVEAIDSKLTPGQLVQESWGYLKSGSGAGARKVRDVARQHPLPAALIGIGFGLLAVESTRRGNGRGMHTGRVSQRARGVASRAAGKARAVAGRAGSKVQQASGHARSAIQNVARPAQERASAMSQRARDRVERAGSELRYWIDEQPLVAGGAALLAGLVVGLLIPSTRREDELLGERRDQVLERAKEVGREALETTQEAARAAAASVREELSGATPGQSTTPGAGQPTTMP